MSANSLSSSHPPELMSSDHGSEPSASGSIQIGSRILPTRWFLAPLAGYTHLAFRRIIRELGGLGLATTDLVRLQGSRPLPRQPLTNARPGHWEP